LWEKEGGQVVQPPKQPEPAPGEVSLPEGASGVESPSLVVSIAGDERIFAGSKEVARADLAGIFEKLINANPDAKLVIRSDSDVPYGSVVEIMDIANKAGVADVSLVAQ